jgi:hypothetical protein
VEAIKIEIDQQQLTFITLVVVLLLLLLRLFFQLGLLGERLYIEMGSDSVMTLVVPGECGEEAHLGESRRGRCRGGEKSIKQICNNESGASPSPRRTRLFFFFPGGGRGKDG